jgi:hypothetical protein
MPVLVGVEVNEKGGDTERNIDADSVEEMEGVSEMGKGFDEGGNAMVGA